MEMNVNVQLVTIGKKAAKYFKRRPQYKLAGAPPPPKTRPHHEVAYISPSGLSGVWGTVS